MNHILVIEDEPEIQELLTAYLRSEGYSVALAEDGICAMDKFRSSSYDLVLLDIMLPKIDGFGVCELIRRESNVPIIMLTALDGETEQLRGFELKIDDYVTKPFSMPVLLQKIAAVLRRSSGCLDTSVVRYNEICLYPDTRECRAGDSMIELTRKEFDLLSALVRAPGRVFTREVLLSHIWGYDFLGDERIVDSHIKNLRKKLPINCIETIRGVGYRAAKQNEKK